MPYIKKKDKRRIGLDVIDGDAIKTSGELNYAITVMVYEYWKRSGNYQGINDIVGALDGAKAEFQRRVVGPYEDLKIKENGDVYE